MQSFHFMERIRPKLKLIKMINHDRLVDYKYTNPSYALFLHKSAFIVIVLTRYLNPHTSSLSILPVLGSSRRSSLFELWSFFLSRMGVRDGDERVNLKRSRCMWPLVREWGLSDGVITLLFPSIIHINPFDDFPPVNKWKSTQLDS